MPRKLDPKVATRTIRLVSKLTRLVKKRIWIAVAAMFLVAVGGAFAGYMLGSAAIWRTTQEDLTQDAQIAGDQFLSLLNESSSMLRYMNALKGPSCSDAEIAEFRTALFQTQKLKDAGRMRDGKLYCSSQFGKEHLSEKQFQPSLTREDGIRIYVDLPPYTSDKWRAYIFQQNDAYVAITVERTKTFQPTDVFFESTLIDAVLHQRVRPSGMPVLHSDAILDRNAKGRVGNLLYATLCMPQSDVCTSAFTSIQTVVKNNRVLLGLDSTLGAVVGAFIVLLIFFSHMRSHSMSQQLRRAIRRKEVSILYQPIVDLETGKIVRAEALARWKDEEGFAVNPEIFVRLAEERGFIDELTKLVVHTVLQDFGTALRSESNFHMNINVTATDLHGAQLMPMLREALTNAGVAPSRLAIEITEGSTVRSSVERAAIRQLRDAGHSVQIDDFGTGYSSLAYLKDLSVDAIKIDKAFTMAIGTEAVTLGILPQILAMAETLHLQVVVEGIETVEQAAYFAGKERPVLGQGWLFGKPMAADDLLCMMIRKPDYEEELSGDDLVVRKEICSSRN